MLRNFHACLRQRANRTQRRQIVECNQSREAFFSFQQFFRKAVTSLEPRSRIEGIRALQRQRRTDLHSRRVRKLLNAAPPRCTVNQHLWSANESDLLVAELMEV